MSYEVVKSFQGNTDPFKFPPAIAVTTFTVVASAFTDTNVDDHNLLRVPTGINKK